MQFRFYGHFERDESYVYAVCDSAPVASHGADEEAALALLGECLQVYLETLEQHNQVRLAEKSGMLVLLADGRLSEQVPEAGPVSIKRLGGSFVAEATWPPTA